MAKRRANGEGNIRKRKDGRWEGRYTAGTDPETGKQIFKNVLGKTQAEVKEKLKRALEEAKKVDFTRTGKYTVEQWMDEWFENVCKIKVRPSSHQTYRGYIDHHVAPNIGKIPLEKLSTMDLQKLYTGLSEDNAKFLSDGMAKLRGNCPPAGFEDMFILDPGSQAYYRARGVLFILNSLIELMRNDPGMCRRADKLYQFFIASHTSGSSDSADSRNEWLHLTAHMLSEEEYMRYISNETAKAFDAYLVSKCLSGIPSEPK